MQHCVKAAAAELASSRCAEQMATAVAAKLVEVIFHCRSLPSDCLPLPSWNLSLHVTAFP